MPPGVCGLNGASPRRTFGLGSRPHVGNLGPADALGKGEVDVKLASSDAALADRSPAGERRRDLASAGTGTDDRSVFVTAAPWRAQALRGIGYATGALTVLWLVALIAGAVGAGRLPAVPFPAIGHLGDAHARQQPAPHAPPRATTSDGIAHPPLLADPGSAAVRRGRDASPRPGRPASSQPRVVPRGGGRTAPGAARGPASGGRQPAASPPASAPVPLSPGAPQPGGGAPGTASPPATGAGSGSSVRTVASGRRATGGASTAPASGRSASPPATTPGTAHRPTTTG